MVPIGILVKHEKEVDKMTEREEFVIKARSRCKPELKPSIGVDKTWLQGKTKIIEYGGRSKKYDYRFKGLTIYGAHKVSIIRGWNRTDGDHTNVDVITSDGKKMFFYIRKAGQRLPGERLP
jgi:hypothetical protein